MKVDRRVLAVVLAIVFVGDSAIARAQTSNDFKIKCANAYEQAQRTRNEGLFRASRENLLICADDLCPPVLRNECVKWLGENDAATPTVMIVARDSAGNEVSDVAVTIDGTKVLERLDGKAMPVDPGVHTFRFARTGSDTVEQKVLIREAEKRRPVLVTFGAAAVPAVPEKPSSATGGIPAGTWILTGLGVVALGVSVPMYIGYFDKKSRLDKCSPGCNPADGDSARRQLLSANVATWIGVAAIASGLIVWAATPSTRVSASVAPLPGGVAGSFTVAF